MSAWLHAVYPGFLLTSLACLAYIDRAWRLAFWKRPRRTALVLTIAIVYFSIWDLFGIHLHIFYAGTDTYRSGIMLAPAYPIEELLFLTLLNYTALLCWAFPRRTR